MLFMCTVLYFLLSTTNAKAGIHVQGHLEVGEGIAELFNGLVEQFQVHTDREARDFDAGHQEQFKDERFPLKILDETLRYFNNPGNEEEREVKDERIDEITNEEEPLLKQLRNMPENKLVHLYGHHMFDMVKSPPLNEANEVYA